MNITYNQIMGFDPCYDPQEIGIPVEYSATVKDFISEYRSKVKDKSDILWVFLREDFFNGRDLRLFGVWCAQQVKHLMQDERSLNALDVAEKYAFGEVGEDVLVVARDAARAAAWAAARAAASEAASDAARAARAAAWAAASEAASDAAGAARAAARAAASDAAWAAWDAAGAASAAARAAASDAAWAAWDAAGDLQIDKLLEVLDKPNGEWFVRN